MRSPRLRQELVFYVMAAIIVSGVAGVIAFQPDQAALRIAVIVLSCAVTASITSLVLAKRRSRQLFDDRASLSDEEIYGQVAESGLPRPLVLELWREVADELHLPPDKLRVTDRFGRELGGYWITSEELDALSRLAARRARRLGAGLDLAEIKTLGEYVRRLAASRGDDR